MDTKYIGPLLSENASTGRSVEVEFRVEPSEAYDGKLDLGIFRYHDGEGIRTVYLDRSEAEKLRDGLSEWIEEV